jgi:thiamine pyrophosphate-dependent acetolactate synthase large subunit-like protein
LVIPPLAKFPVPNRAVPSREDAERVLSMLRGAKNPVIIMGRCSRTMEAWDERIALVEALNVRVVSRTAAIFPTNHPQHAGRAGKPGATKALREADVILDLDSLDLGGILAKLDGKATVISCSVDQLVHKGWSMDYLQLPPVDFSISAVPDTLVSELVKLLGNPKRKATAAPAKAAASKNGNGKAQTAGLIGIDTFSREVSHALSDIEVCYTRLPGSINVDDFEFTHPLDCVGGEGGGGLGSGPGAAVGAALALRGTSRLPVCVTGDGDFLMGVTALWTAVANKIPLLVIVANNRSYFNDEVHQEHIANHRGRPPERKWIGMRIDNPPPDLTGFAKAQGAIGIGPIESREKIAPAIAEAVAHVRAGKVVVLEVIVAPEYSEGVAAGITSTAEPNTPHSFTRG